jgi:hypothetical protein
VWKDKREADVLFLTDRHYTLKKEEHFCLQLHYFSEEYEEQLEWLDVQVFDAKDPGRRWLSEELDDYWMVERRVHFYICL